MGVNIFAGGPKVSETLGESNENNRSLNNPVKFDGAGLYKPFENPEKNKTGSEKMQVKLKKEKGEYYSKYKPIINRLVKSGQIKESVGEELLKKELNKNQDDNITEGITEITGITDKEKTIITQSFAKIEQKNPKKNLSLFSKDINTIKEGINIKGFDFKTGKNGKFESEVLNKIGENYTEFKDQKGKKDIEADFSTAILETRAQILSEVKNIKKDTETYAKAMQNIDSGNLEKQLDGIETLYHMAYEHEGALAKKGLDSFMQKKKQNLLKKYSSLNKQILELQEIKNKTEKQQLEFKKLQDELASVINQAREVDSGEVFKAGKLDQNKSEIEGGVETK